METLLDALLYFSRVGRSELAMKPTDLESVLGNILESLDVSLKEHRVFIDVPQIFPTVSCDSTRSGEIFRNLITNAMKYNDKSEKWIEIGYLEESAHGVQPQAPLVFYVRDNGIGIREKHRHSIFRIFKRLHARDKFGGGTGAGLTMTKKMIERHGGRIWVESIYGEGTTFYFTLEKVQDAAYIRNQSIDTSEAVVR
jgi:light-regulated signal transduction histidine kinase (bacteriophytochrome)